LWQDNWREGPKLNKKRLSRLLGAAGKKKVRIGGPNQVNGRQAFSSQYKNLFTAGDGGANHPRIGGKKKYPHKLNKEEQQG